MRKRDLCQECWEASSTPSEREIAASRCYICGAGFNVGGTDPLARRFGVQRMRFFCFQCSPIYNDCVSRALAGVPRDLSAEEQSALLATLTDDVDRQVRQKLGGKQ